MADNRMFLVHVPSGLAVPLAKRYKSWFTNDDEDNCRTSKALSHFFETIETEHGYCGDDFAIALENADGATSAIANWFYGNVRDNGIVELVITK